MANFKSFTLLSEKDGKRKGIVHTMHGDFYTPAFGPDATRGVIKNIDPKTLKTLDPNIQIAADTKSETQLQRWHQSEQQFMLTNTYHMLSYPGPEFIKNLGGLHTLMQWDRPILTDSGGFQVFSLIHKSKTLNGKVDEDGALFRHPYTGQKFKLTPEKAIDIQFDFGSDIMVVLDDCRHYQDHDNLEASVHRTIAWAKRCKKQFLKNLREQYNMGWDDGPRPLIFSVIQGGVDKELREYCTRELVKIGFDGFGFGGWAVNENAGRDKKTSKEKEEEYLPYKIMKFTADLIPKDKPRYAMGVGTPTDMEHCIKAGYDMFDCVIPSRNGRHGLCYTTQGPVRISNAKFKTDKTPLDPNLNSVASQYPKFFLHHLFKIKDPLGGNLLTAHNLKFFHYVMKKEFDKLND